MRLPWDELTWHEKTLLVRLSEAGNRGILARPNSLDSELSTYDVEVLEKLRERYCLTSDQLSSQEERTTLWELGWEWVDKMWTREEEYRAELEARQAELERRHHERKMTPLLDENWREEFSCR